MNCVGVQLDDVALVDLWHVLNDNSTSSVDPVRRKERIRAAQTDNSFKNVPIEGRESVIELMYNGKSVSESKGTEYTHHALPQLGSSRSTVVCRAIRTTGSSSAFSSRRGRSFLTFSFAVKSPLRNRCCKRNSEHIYSAGLVLSKHSSQFCDCQEPSTKSFKIKPTGSGNVAGLSKVDAISFSILKMVICMFRSISVVSGVETSCSAVASRL